MAVLQIIETYCIFDLGRFKDKLSSVSHSYSYTHPPRDSTLSLLEAAVSEKTIKYGLVGVQGSRQDHPPQPPHPTLWQATGRCLRLGAG